MSPGPRRPPSCPRTFLVTVELAYGKRYLPIACKYGCDLRERYEREKLEIQRLFWAALGLDLMVVTEKEIDRIFAENLTFISSFLRGKAHDPPTIERSHLLPERVPPRTYTIQSLVEELSHFGDFDDEQARQFLYGSIWHRALSIDLTLDFQETGYIDVLGWDPIVLASDCGRSHANLA